MTLRIAAPPLKHGALGGFAPSADDAMLLHQVRPETGRNFHRVT